MKLKLYQVAHDGEGVTPNHAHYWDLRPSDETKIMREVEVEVPDLPCQEYIDSFIEAKKDERRQAEIAALKERLAKLESSND